LAALILVGAFHTAPWLDDSWTFWIPKGLSLGNLGLDPRLFTPNAHYAALTHRSYPVFWSLTAELALRFAGHIDLRAVTGELAVLTLAFAGAIVRALAGRVRPALLWLGVALFLLCPEVAHQTQGGGADLVLGVYLGMFVLCAFGCVTDRSRGALALAAVFGSVALATKVEGLPEFAICAFVACLTAWHVDRRTWRPLLGAVFAASLSSVPWFVWAQLRAGREPTADYGSSLELSHGIPPTSRLGPAVHALGAQALSSQHWLLIVPVTVSLYVVLAVRERKIDWLAPAVMIIAIFAFFVWLYWFNSPTQGAPLSTTVYRVFAPIALLSAAALPLALDRVLVPIPRWEIAVAALPCASALVVLIAVTATPAAQGGSAPIIGSPPVAVTQVRGTVLHRWAFSPRFARGWTTFDGLAAAAGPVANRTTAVNKPKAGSPKRRASSCLTAVTGASPFAYQLDVRDLWPAAAEALGELSNPRLIRGFEAGEGWIYRTAAAVTATTRPFCRHIDQVAGRHIAAHLPNGALDSLVTLPEKPLPAGDFVVGYAGNIGIAQGLDIVLDAADRLRRDGVNDVRFAIVGGGPLAAAFEAERERRGLESVTVTSAVEVGQIGDFLRASHALLIPLRKHALLEDFIPSKLYDAMAVGRPAIVAAGREAAAVVNETGCGLVLGPEDGAALAEALRMLADDRQLAQALGAAGRRAAPRFARSRQVEYLEEILLNAAGTTG
jgi:glycosyltransferase involved in cell wall biosynthesis